MPPFDPSLRISDAERNRAVDDLRVAFADGRLTLEEYEERVDEAHAAKTLGELAKALRHLPVPIAEAQRRAHNAGATVSNVIDGLPLGNTLKTQIRDRAELEVFRRSGKAVARAERQQALEAHHQARMQRRLNRPSLGQRATRYAIFSAFLAGIWLLTGGGYFWPAWVMLVLGLRLALLATRPRR